ASIEPYLNAAIGGNSVSFENQIRDCQNLPRQVKVSYVPHVIGNRVEGLISLITDISDQKEGEAERLRLLAREKAARSEAEAANRAKDDFLATVSHELRTPLNAILGWAQILQTGTLSDSRRMHALETIERNAKLQAQLIDDILDVSRIITGKLRLNPQRIDL